MEKFKKIYIEITNRCNLNCSFCNNTKRKKEDISIEHFKTIIEKIRAYTDYVYLHVKGEPLLHNELREIIQICNDNNINVSITTNGTLLKNRFEELKDLNIRQLNVSLHSENSLEDYFSEVFECCDKMSTKTYISYRIWTLVDNKLDKKSTSIVNKLIEHYNISPEIVNNIYDSKSIKLKSNIYLDKENIFEWPGQSVKINNSGTCYGLKTHIAILVDGSVVPCCLDGEGAINLGNIYQSSLEDILSSQRVRKIVEGFKKNQVTEDLCSKCTYRNRFNNK